MTEKKVIIIGGGIAGLSTGCYLQMNGYQTEIMEMGRLPGGLCTAWSRKGYTFNGCIHWLVGSGPKIAFYNLWKELGIIQAIKFVDKELFMAVDLPQGDSFTVYTDVDKLEKELMRIAPEDEKQIKHFTNMIRFLKEQDLPITKAPELYGLLDLAKLIIKNGRYLKYMNTWNKISVKEYGERFTNPFVRENFGELFGFSNVSPVMYLMNTLAWLSAKSAGSPIGGSLEFSKVIEKRYVELGGQIHYNSKVASIIVEDNKAVGVRLHNGKEFRADLVISAADGYKTIFEMLNGQYLNDEIKYCYENYETFAPKIFVSLGVARTFEGVPHSLNMLLDQAIDTSDTNKEARMRVKIYNFDPTLAPEGSTSITAYLTTSYEYWNKLKKEDPKQYRAEKERVAQAVIEELDKRFGNIRSTLEVHDVSTPCTIERYTNNWKGSWQGWRRDHNTLHNRNKLKRTLPGLENFYMVGHWAEVGGGLPSVALAGRNLVQVICKKDEKKFVTTVD